MRSPLYPLVGRERTWLVEAASSRRRVVRFFIVPGWKRD
jgi:hypothetical protein